MSQGKSSEIQWSYLPIKPTNSNSNPPPRRVREKDDKTISNIPETIKKPFSKLPSANELLPKLKSTIENPKIALRISIQPLPVFSGKAPQKEELSRCYSESSLNPKTKKRNLRQELNRYQAIRQSDTQYDVKFQSLESSSFAEINKTGMNNLFSSKKSIPMKKKSNIVGSNFNQTIKSTQKISDQQSIKCNQEPQNSSQNLRQSSPEDIMQGNLRGRNQLCSPIKRQQEITNLQRYFLKLNIVYKKYSEITEESTQTQGIYSSNVVQFNSVYCDIRSLVKAQGEEAQDEQVKQHNLIDNPAKPSYLMEKTGWSKQQSQQIKRQQSDSQPHQEKNKSKQDLIQENQDVPKKMETNSKNKKKIQEQKQQALGPSVTEEIIYAPFYKLKDANDKTLIFESRFESGNLAQVAKLSDQEYDLLLQNDINTHGYTQWFFFKVSNTRALEKVKFNILNFQKFDSLFTKGMKVLVYSRHLSSTQAKGWYRSCEKISYQRNQFVQRDSTASSVSPSSPEKKSPSPGNPRIVQETKNLFTLSFEHEFEHSDDEVYFAYNYPYTYTELQTYLAGIEDSKSHIASRRLLCRTLAGNRIDLLTITSQNSQTNKQG